MEGEKEKCEEVPNLRLWYVRKAIRILSGVQRGKQNWQYFQNTSGSTIDGVVEMSKFAGKTVQKRGEGG